MSEPETTLPPPDVVPEAVTEVAAGVWVIPDGRVPLVPNVGIVLGDERALVVDVGMGPVNGARVLEAARRLAGARPLVVTTTHFHPEHAFGLQSFVGEARSLVNRAQHQELLAKGEAYLGMFRTFAPTVAEALEGVELVDPDELYDGDIHELDLGGRVVELRARGVAHTRGDQVVFVPDARVLFAGDLVEERIFPIYPWFPPDDADVDGSRWIEVLRWLESLEPAIVVPGHGTVGDAGLIGDARGYHERLREETFSRVDAGLDADAVVAEVEPLLRTRYPDWEQPEWIGFGARCFHAERSA